MRELILISSICFRLLSFSQNDIKDTLFFNSTIPRNSLSITMGGSAILYSVGYQRCFRWSRDFRSTFEIQASYFDAVYIPLTIACEAFQNSNKLVFGASFNSRFDPFYNYISLKDLQDLKNTTKPLYQRPHFFYVPYGSLLAGYKKYFSNKHSISVCPTLIIYPIFIADKDNPSGSKLGPAFQPYLTISYYYQFNSKHEK